MGCLKSWHLALALSGRQDHSRSSFLFSALNPELSNFIVAPKYKASPAGTFLVALQETSNARIIKIIL